MLLHVILVIFPDHHTAAAGNNGLLAFLKLDQCVALQIPEIHLTVFRENLRNRHPLLIDDQLIHLHIVHLQLTLQLLGNGALSCTHKPDQENIVVKQGLCLNLSAVLHNVFENIQDLLLKYIISQLLLQVILLLFFLLRLQDRDTILLLISNDLLNAFHTVYQLLDDNVITYSDFFADLLDSVIHSIVHYPFSSSGPNQRTCHRAAFIVACSADSDYMIYRSNTGP